MRGRRSLLAAAGGLVLPGAARAQGRPRRERILAGAAPGDLAIELPTRFDFALDLRVARAIRVDLPLTLLAQADAVIE
jgi:putative ABC transport system substrate-binding protein